MKLFTKSLTTKSKKLIFKSSLIYLVVLLSVITFFWGVKYYFNSSSSKLAIYNPSLPAATETVDKPFESKVYFNNVLGETDFLDRVVEMIDQSQKTLEIAMFSLDSRKVVDAIYRANNRGVKVTLVLDLSRADKHSLALVRMPSGIERIDVGSFSRDVSTKTTYMHHKFVLVDRGQPQSKLLTGSMDFTAKGEKYEQSFYMITPDQTLLSYYGKVFDILKRGEYGNLKLEDESYNPWLAHINYSDSYIDLWSSPGYHNQSIKYKVIDLIENAKKSIKVMMWQFNDKNIAQELVKAAKKGVKVTVVSDDLVAYDGHSAIPDLKAKAVNIPNQNLIVTLDEKSKDLIDLSKLRDGFNPFVHHHFMIVDDNTLVFGTNNWTDWGFRMNDEDAMITNNTYLVGEFDKTFQYLLGTFQ